MCEFKQFYGSNQAQIHFLVKRKKGSEVSGLKPVNFETLINKFVYGQGHPQFFPILHVNQSGFSNIIYWGGFFFDLYDF